MTKGASIVLKPRPLWQYGLICLIAAVLPQLFFPPPQTPQDAAARFNVMVLFSASGLIMIVWSGVQIWRRRD